MRFNVEILEELIYCAPGDIIDGVELIQTEYVDSGRWEEHWTMVVRFNDSFYRLNYELPATEYQEQGQSPFEMTMDLEGFVTGKRVVPKEKTIIVYEDCGCDGVKIPEGV